jgi:class 3 adenylate cyclase
VCRAIASAGLHRVGDSRVTVDAGHYLAAQIPRAKYVELPGVNHIPLDITDRIADEIEEFLTGSRAEVEGDRVLATVMFTDIADSTRRAAELGDRSWRALLDRHDDVVRQQLARFRGREIKTLGDGFLTTFDGPARAVRCASAIIEQVRSLGIDVRSGLHTGEIEIQQGDVLGIAVNIAARIAELAGSREVLVSSTVRDLVAGSSLRFHDRGSHRLRGLMEPLRLFGPKRSTRGATLHGRRHDICGQATAKSENPAGERGAKPRQHDEPAALNPVWVEAPVEGEGGKVWNRRIVVVGADVTQRPHPTHLSRSPQSS